MYKKIISAAALLAMSVSTAAFAGGKTTTLYANATVSTSCAFSTNNGGASAAQNDFNFGDITTAVGNSVSATAALTYVCNTIDTNLGISLSDVNGIANTQTFNLKNTNVAQNLLPYTIAQSTGSLGAFTDSSVAFQVAQNNPIALTATLNVPATLPAGSYTDTITATLNP